VIDYKSGNVSSKAWELPRPDDVQLPLYAIFGLDGELRARLSKDSRDAAATIDADSEGRLGGLVFGKVRAAEHCFAGKVGDAKALLLSDVPAGSALARRKFTPEELMDWREYIEQMAQDFLAGRADVDPRQYPQTCEQCDLRALCRIQEDPVQVVEADIEEACDE
jgi:ATP-dependent helicase/nuclease subunit B